ncbi:restriction endonuclease-like super family [Candidatus Termititenax persephonae]|uniref:Restriction endonuclease-like super family n=1 Tax=Candidatus Termititenax persephonae TaxID=2218525 RepID=A0A388TI53_9BACT|nr:restriction endonuclease-like super family [Candidatus Termititenax persephonae]
MSRIRSQNTKPELLLGQYLRDHGLRDFQKNVKNLPGTPDICFLDKKLAVFVHGCFWHGCPHCRLKQPETHADFWRKKIARTRERDRQAVSELRRLGWRTLEIWECELKKDILAAALEINNLYYGITA